MAKKSNEKRKLTFGSKQLEDFFVQWTISKNPEGKLYYAKSLISKIKDDHSKLINMLILAFIFSYEDSLIDYDAACNLFERAENLFINFNSNSRIRDRILYIINIFAGFTELKRYGLDEAHAKFQNAMQYNKWSVNAKFYSALTEIRMDNPDEALNSLMEVIEYDEMRLKFAITSNNYLLFKYFLNSNYIEKIFFYNDFSILFDVFQQLTSEKLDRGIASINEIISKTEGLNNKKSFRYLKEANRKDLIFIEKLIKDYKDSQNYYVHSSILIIEKKLNNIIESIIKNIKDQNNTKLELHENLYNEKIISESGKIKDLEDELEFDQKELEIEFTSRKKQLTARWLKKYAN
jgi:ribosomal protein L22